MALGNSGIAAARQELSTVGAKVVAARSSNQNSNKSTITTIIKMD